MGKVVGDLAEHTSNLKIKAAIVTNKNSRLYDVVAVKEQETTSNPETNNLEV